MSIDISVVLEVVLGSALGAGAAFVGIWVLFFKTRIEHLQAISAPNLANELRDVSQMLDQSVREKGELLEQFIDSLKRALPKMLEDPEGPVQETMEVVHLTGKAEGAFESSKELAEIMKNHFAAVAAGAETRIPDALWSEISKHMSGLSEFVRGNISAAKLKIANLLAEFARMGKV